MIIQLILVAIRFRWIWVEKAIENLPAAWAGLSQSAFAGYGLKSWLFLWRGCYCFVAIRFRWIWVEKTGSAKCKRHTQKSQSAFAGYGLKRHLIRTQTEEWKGRNPLSLDMGWKELRNDNNYISQGLVAIRFRWIWVEKLKANLLNLDQQSRNPLSLDMGWKESKTYSETFQNTVAIRFRWIWVEKLICFFIAFLINLVAIRFRWIWVEKCADIDSYVEPNWSQSAFAGYGLKSLMYEASKTYNLVAIRFRWIWVEKKRKRKHSKR